MGQYPVPQGSTGWYHPSGAWRRAPEFDKDLQAKYDQAFPEVHTQYVFTEEI